VEVDKVGVRQKLRLGAIAPHRFARLTIVSTSSKEFSLGGLF
jgi:hypothetical protein